jgi:NAD(P)H-hydrate epimerase
MPTTKSPSNKPVELSAELVRDLVPTRGAHAHKWGVGGVLIVGGSPGYIGAPALAARAAGRSGAGIVTIASPRSTIGAIASIVPEATFIPLPEGDLGPGGERAADKIRESLDRYRAILVGTGLGKDEYATAVMNGLSGASTITRASGSVGFSVHRESTVQPTESSRTSIIGATQPTVIDADGLNWLAEQDGWESRFAPGSLVLTPHIGEMARLTNLDAEEILANPVEIAQTWAAKWKQTVVLKANTTVVSDGTTTRVSQPAPALATAGSGDVLAGSICAFLAQGLTAIDAASLAIYLGGAAATSLASRLSVIGVVASDLPDAIAEATAALI